MSILDVLREDFLSVAFLDSVFWRFEGFSDSFSSFSSSSSSSFYFSSSSSSDDTYFFLPLGFGSSDYSDSLAAFFWSRLFWTTPLVGLVDFFTSISFLSSSYSDSSESDSSFFLFAPLLGLPRPPFLSSTTGAAFFAATGFLSFFSFLSVLFELLTDFSLLSDWDYLAILILTVSDGATLTSFATFLAPAVFLDFLSFCSDSSDSDSYSSFSLFL